MGDEAVNQAQERGFSRTGLAHHQDHFTFLNFAGEIFQNRLCRVRVDQRDMGEGNHENTIMVVAVSAVRTNQESRANQGAGR